MYVGAYEPCVSGLGGGKTSEASYKTPANHIESSLPPGRHTTDSVRTASINLFRPWLRRRASQQRAFLPIAIRPAGFPMDFLNLS